jgi:hypothetical protein
MIAMLLPMALELAAPDWRAAQCGGDQVVGRYTNFAEGFSVAIPKEFVGRRGSQAGPERGVSIALLPNCDAFIVVFGEPNSMLLKSAAAAVDNWLAEAAPANAPLTVNRHTLKMGPLNASAATINSRESVQVEEVAAAFRRPGGEPVYWAILVSSRDRYEGDRKVLNQVLHSFRLERWR